MTNVQQKSITEILEEFAVRPTSLHEWMGYPAEHPRVKEMEVVLALAEYFTPMERYYLFERIRDEGRRGE